MIAFLIRRAGRTMLVLFGVLSLLFFAERVSGDPAQFLLSGQAATPETLQRFRHELGLDESLPQQYGEFLSGAIHGSFGQSFVYQRPATGLVMQRMPATVRLAVAAMVVGLVLAVPVGVWAAVHRGGWRDATSMGVVQVGQALPVFWLGLILVFLFAVKIRWFPVAGDHGFKSLVLPAVTLGVYFAATVARVTRSAMIDVLSQDYIRTARSKGLQQRNVIVRHAIRNAAIPILTIVSIQFGVLLGGAVVVEAIFLWPGVGTLILQAVNSHDYPVIEAGVAIFAVMFVVVNMCVDMLYSFIDPRVRL